MFTPRHLLPQYDSQTASGYRERWQSEFGQEIRKKITDMIREGAGEDFMQYDFERGQLGFLESTTDLKGFGLWQEDISFPLEDNFEGSDFSYSQFWHSKLKGATFSGCQFRFSRIFNCEFNGCIFGLTSFYGTYLEKVRFINCDFWDVGNSLLNCELSNAQFINCYFHKNIFFDCRFDQNTKLDSPSSERVANPSTDYKLDQTELADTYRAIKEAYKAGGVVQIARDYFYLQMHSIIRYNTSSRAQQIWGFLSEFITGYGVKPTRVLRAMVLAFLLFWSLFTYETGLTEALLLTAGAFFTFGAYSDVVVGMNLGFRLLYVLTAFSGISFTALFITVLANVWLQER